MKIVGREFYWTLFPENDEDVEQLKQEFQADGSAVTVMVTPCRSNWAPLAPPEASTRAMT